MGGVRPAEDVAARFEAAILPNQAAGRSIAGVAAARLRDAAQGDAAFGVEFELEAQPCSGGIGSARPIECVDQHGAVGCADRRVSRPLADRQDCLRRAVHRCEVDHQAAAVGWQVGRPCRTGPSGKAIGQSVECPVFGRPDDTRLCPPVAAFAQFDSRPWRGVCCMGGGSAFGQRQGGECGDRAARRGWPAFAIYHGYGIGFALDDQRRGLGTRATPDSFEHDDQLQRVGHADPCVIDRRCEACPR